LNVVLGVSGSVAAYRAADLARELMRSGCTVRVCLTDAAEEFVTRALFEALTGQPCLVDTFEEPLVGRMAHIDWARAADLLIIAPATANTINKLAAGQADDMLTSLALAYTGPILIAPAMNPSMYAKETTQASMRRLQAEGAIFVEPAEGDVACGEHGQGKLASIPRITEEALTLIRRAELLRGKHILITSGPTQEPIDDVRYLTNRSSGKMGAALARAALLMGAKVTVVSGPASAALPLRAEVIRVRTAEEMLDAALEQAPKSDLIIGVAAVADYRPAKRLDGKMRRSGEPLTLDLVPNSDVLAELAASAPQAVSIGFAAEPSADEGYAREKLDRKGLTGIALNDVSRGDVGFDADQNDLTLLFRDGRVERSGKRSKLACALWMLENIAGQLKPSQ
jgi:phosphopantothenoylcysteine decarboxylase / phosphopantothenate---cysteine ligase